MYKKIFMLPGILLLGFIGVLFFYGAFVREDAGRHSGGVYSDPAASGIAEAGKEKNDSAEDSAIAKETAAQAASGDSRPGAPSAVIHEQPSTESRINQKYTARLQSLAVTYEGKLNSLLGKALDEYASARENDPHADIGPLVNKYYSAGKSLEDECDSRVYPVLDAYEKELKANGLPPDAALRAREEYEARKSARASLITSMKP